MRQLFYVLSRETVGDYGLAYALHNTYLSRLVEIASKKKTDLEEKPDQLCSFHSNKDDAKDFFQSFDKYCEDSIDAIVNGWVNYGDPIISLDKFHEWVDKAPALCIWHFKK